MAVVTTNNFDRVIEQRVVSRLRRLEPKDVRLRSALKNIGFQIEGEAKVRIVRQGLVKDGGLLNSIMSEVIQRQDVVQLVAGSRGVPYAAIHEYGGTIVPRRAKALAIPLHDQFRGRSPRDVPGLHLRKTKDGRAFLVKRQGDIDTYAYVLRSSVKIPARPYLRPAFDKVAPRLLEMLREIFRRKPKVV